MHLTKNKPKAAKRSNIVNTQEKYCSYKNKALGLDNFNWPVHRTENVHETIAYSQMKERRYKKCGEKNVKYIIFLLLMTEQHSSHLHIPPKSVVADS